MTVVGTGFLVAGQVTAEARSAIRAADRLLHLVSDTPTRDWLERLNPRHESLEDAYAEGRPRTESYEEMVRRILAPVRAGKSVCAAFYGHPGVFVHPSHEAIRRARAEGHRARMLPGVSAEDCLFADLEIDPATHGCRSFEATDFLARRRALDPTSHLILWQVGAIGVATYHRRAVWRTDGLAPLAERLSESYSGEHPVTLYIAATLPVSPPTVHRLPLARLAAPPAGVTVSIAATLHVPPAEQAPVDHAVLERLRSARTKERPC